MDTIKSEVHIWLGARTAEDLYVFGTVVGSILVTIGVVAWIKRSYLRKNAHKLASEFIVLNVAFWSFLLSVSGFIVTQGAAFGSLLPWIGTHWPQISSGAIATHAVATALHKWWRDRRDGKPIVTDELIDGIVDLTATPAQKKSIPQVTPDIWQS